jgi:hypothetical protein
MVNWQNGDGFRLEHAATADMFEDIHLYNLRSITLDMIELVTEFNTTTSEPTRCTSAPHNKEG